jgi:hypothetical protein
MCFTERQFRYPLLTEYRSNCRNGQVRVSSPTSFEPGLIAVFLGVGLWGAYLGLSQGLLSALVADYGAGRS